MTPPPSWIFGFSQARVSRPTSCKPSILYRPILMEDLYMEFILFIYLICSINCLFYIYDHVCHDNDGKSPEYGKTPRFSHTYGPF